MDAVGYSQEVYDKILADYLNFASRIELKVIVAIPLSALRGDNVTESSVQMPWYRGPTLLDHLESVPIDDQSQQLPLRMPVQWVNRPNQDFRGFAGTLAGGRVRRGDGIKVLPSAKGSRVARIVRHGGDTDEAVAGESITLTLEHDIDISRGDIISAADAPAPVADQFQATIIWMHEEAMYPGRPYWLKIGTRTVSASITSPRYKVNVNTLEHVAAKQLEMNEIGVCNIALDRAVAFDSYRDNRVTGAFILIDKMSRETIAAGMINFALRRADNIHWQALDINKAVRSAAKGQRACVLWFTGLSGAGKSTIANLVDKRLTSLGRHTYILDGDNVRHGLNKDLGFTDVDRVENIRRIAEVARLMVDAGLIVLVSFISPFRAERRMARDLLQAGEFFEIFVDTPLADAEKRDVKGLYAKARRGEIGHFTGISSPYEVPENAEIHVDTMTTSPERAAELIVKTLIAADVLSARDADPAI